MSFDMKEQLTGFVVMPRLQFDQLVDKLLYQHFIESANFQPSKSCNKGQTIVSFNRLSKETGWSYGVIRGACKRLVRRGYITTKTLPQKRGILITITDYDRLQNLGNYQKTNKENNNQLTKDEQTENKEINKETDSANVDVSRDCDNSKDSINKENNKPLTKNEQTTNKEINNTRTTINNNNNNKNIKTYKDLREFCKRKLPRVSNSDEVETFVNLLTQLDVFPEINVNWLARYIDTIRLTRTTCRISTNVLIDLFEKVFKYNADIIHYALATHIMHHDDKKEEYTLGILRNTNVHEARRKLMKILNKGRGDFRGSHSSSIRRTYGTEQHDEYEEFYL